MFHKKFALLFIMTSLLTFAIYTAEAQRRQPLAIVEKGLVSYWALDKIKKSPKGSDIVEDIIGENDGVVNGKPKVVEGKYDNALEFDGIKDFILLPTKNLNSGNQPMTATAWLFLKKKGPGGPAWHSVCFLWTLGDREVLYYFRLYRKKTRCKSNYDDPMH